MRLRKPQNQDMRIRILALGLAWTASLCAQHRRFSWQDACFKNPGAPFCDGHEYAVKPVPPGKDGVSRSSVKDPSPPQSETPLVIVTRGIDWRFADPSADALAGFNFSKVSASPLAHGLIAQLVAGQGATEADIRKIFAGLCGADKIALSLRENQIVMMVTGRAPDSILPTLEAGWKAVTVPGNALLLGHAEAVDRAAQRIAMEGPPAELQANSEFWAAGPAGLAGVKRVSLTVSIRDRLTSDLAFEFDGVPDASKLPATLGDAVTEGSVVHLRASDGQIAASPLAQRLASLLMAARYLPQRGVPPGAGHARPVIYGLDSGPKEVNH
jgi:hypothetical protein